MCFLAKCGLNYTFSRRSGLEAQAGTTCSLGKSEDVSLANNASTIRQGVGGWEKKTNTVATAFAEARSLFNSTVRRGSDFSLTSRGLLLPRASRQVLAHSQIVLNLSLYLPT